MRFRSERKEGVVVRLADASKRRNIPETLGTICSCPGYYLFRGRDLLFDVTLMPIKNLLSITELSEKAKQDLMEFEEQERQKRQNRHGGRGRGGRVRGGCPSFGLMDFRGGNRGRINDHRPPLMGAMGKLVGYCALTHLRRFSYVVQCCSPLIFFPTLISSHPECLHLISFISSKCSPSSTTLCTQGDPLRSKSMGAHLPNNLFSLSSPHTWNIVPHRSGPRWSLRHGLWAPHHPTSHYTTKSTPHSPKTSILTPISEGIRHHQ